MKKSTFSAISIMLSAAILLGGCNKGKKKEDPSGNGGKEPVPTSGGGESAASRAAVSGVLDCIPSGSTFVVSRSLKDTIDSIEMFMMDIGVGPMVGLGVSRPGDGKQRDSMLMAGLRAKLKLGDGFDPKGSGAVVMLNPNLLGLDFPKQIKDAKARALTDGRPADMPVNYFGALRLEELIVLVIPGTMENMFGDAKTTKVGDLTEVAIGFGKIHAFQKGSHVVAAPSKAAVEAIFGAKKFVKADLSADQMAMINGSEIAMHYGLEPFRPLFDVLFDMADESIAKELEKPTAEVIKMYASMGRGLMNELDAMTIGVKLGSNALNIDSICTARPGSVTAKIFETESKNTGGAKLLNAVPSTPYVLAEGVTGWVGNSDLQDAMMSMFMSMTGPDSFFKIDDETKAQIKQMSEEFKGAVKGIQLAIGGGPGGKGMVSFAYVINCEDSAKLRGALPQAVELYKKMLAGMEMPPGAPKIGMTYTKDAEKVGDLSADAMEITLSGMTEQQAKMVPAILTMVTGEGKLRILVATPDAKTMVMAMGGSTEGLQGALKVAGGTGPIPDMPGTKAVMRLLPENPTMVVLFNPANLMDVIRSGMKIVMRSEEEIDRFPVFKCKTPIAFGAKAKGSALHTGLHIPKDMVKEAIEAIMKEISRRAQEWMNEMGGGGEKAPLPEDMPARKDAPAPIEVPVPKEAPAPTSL